jgi:enamine deaminase RidA (YjgF/YER057c/UK114 family)
MAQIEKYCAPGVYDPPGYSQGIKVTGAQTILFLAGQVAYDKDGSVKHRGDFTAQAREVFRAIKSLVEAGGGSLSNVVKINTYVVDARYRPEYRTVREEFFGAKGPVSTMIE